MSDGYSPEWHRTEAEWSAEPKPIPESVRKAEELRQRIYEQGLRRKRVGYLDSGKL